MFDLPPLTTSSEKTQFPDLRLQAQSYLLWEDFPVSPLEAVSSLSDPGLTSTGVHSIAVCPSSQRVRMGTIIHSGFPVASTAAVYTV